MTLSPLERALARLSAGEPISALPQHLLYVFEAFASRTAHPLALRARQELYTRAL